MSPLAARRCEPQEGHAALTPGQINDFICAAQVDALITAVRP